MREDWEALQQYYDCVDYLHKAPRPLPAGLANGTLQSGLVNVRPRFGAVLLHARRQGQRWLRSGAVIKRVMHWEDEDEADNEGEEDEEPNDEDADDAVLITNRTPQRDEDLCTADEDEDAGEQMEGQEDEEFRLVKRGRWTFDGTAVISG